MELLPHSVPPNGTNGGSGGSPEVGASAATPDASEILERIRSRRGGTTLAFHRLLARLDPVLLERYDEFSSYLLHEPRPGGLDVKTRALVLVGITTALVNDPEGVALSIRLAERNGASTEEILDAITLAVLPAGVPAVEAVASYLEAERGPLFPETE